MNVIDAVTQGIFARAEQKDLNVALGAITRAQRQVDLELRVRQVIGEGATDWSRHPEWVALQKKILEVTPEEARGKVIELVREAGAERRKRLREAA